MDNKQKKEIIVEYYAEVPVYRYAAMAAGISEDTLINWRKADSEFSERLDQARAAWVKKRLPKARIEFALERLEREIFAPPKQEVEHSGGVDPVKLLLEKYGLTEGQEDAGKNDESVSGPRKSST